VTDFRRRKQEEGGEKRERGRGDSPLFGSLTLTYPLIEIDGPTVKTKREEKKEEAHATISFLS